MSNCSILRVGPLNPENGAGAAVLHSAIANHFHGDSSRAENGSGNLLAISNRYFDAHVLLSGLDEPVDDVAINGEAISHPQEDGVILVFDASLSSSFDALGRHHDAALERDRCGELLRLCVGVSRGPSPLSDGSKRSEEEYSRRVLWCLDRGYEYVEVDLTPEGMSRGFDERDKDGFARVAEAIGTCMWSSHAMKRRGGAGVTTARVGPSVRETASGEGVGDNDGGDSKSKSQSDTDGKEAETVPSPKTDPEREKAAVASLMRGVSDDEPRGTDANSEEENADRRQRQQQKEEMTFHQLEHVLSEAKLVREASKNNSMSDEERRERAGDTAMKLMGLLDSFGLGEGDDSSDEGNQGDDG